MTPAALPPTVEIRDALSSSYEELREIALGRDGTHSNGTGLALLVRRGMARWMETCVAALARPPASAPPPRPIEDSPHLPADVRVEVAMVLAQMALSVQAEGATAC